MSRPIAVEGTTSFWGSPVGVLGVAVDWALDPHFVLNAGTGMGVWGVQVAVTPRVRIPLSDTVGLGLEGGLSSGKFRESLFHIAIGNEPASRNVVWFNSGGVLDLRTHGGFHFRGFIGAERAIVNGDDVIPYVGAGFGGAWRN